MSKLKLHFQKPRDQKACACSSAAALFGGDGDQLLGRLGDVIGTLDDLLRNKLHIRGQARVSWEGLSAL